MLLPLLIVVCTVTLVVTISLIVLRIVFARTADGNSRHRENYPDWYSSLVFPEEYFRPPPEFQGDHFDRVRRGYELASRHSLVITGLARDIEQNIGKNLHRLAFIGAAFGDFRIVVFENDSSDSTREVILAASKLDPRISLVPCPEDPSCRLNLAAAAGKGLLSGDRFIKMAEFRNRSLDHIRQTHPTFDLLLVVDLDLAGPISRDGLVTSLTYEDWDAMSAVGLANPPVGSAEWLVYYDSLALVPFGERRNHTTYLGQLRRSIKTIMTAVPDRGSPPIRVNSAFAGCCLYRLRPLVENPTVRYYGRGCEHVTFHASMAFNGHDRIYINPAMTLLHIIEVKPSKNLLERLLFPNGKKQKPEI